MQLNHQLRRPTVLDGRPPLLVLLHGKGDNETGMAQLAADLDPRFLSLSLRAPFATGNHGYRWFEGTRAAHGTGPPASEAEHSRLAVIQCINDAVMGLGVDPRRVYLLGFSQGATLAWSIALTTPRLLRGVVGLAGRIAPAIAALAALAAPAGAASHLTVFIQHGLHDRVSPLGNAQAARDLWVDLGAMMGYREYDAGHELSPAMAEDAAEFLRTQLTRLRTRGAG